MCVTRSLGINVTRREKEAKKTTGAVKARQIVSGSYAENVRLRDFSYLHLPGNSFLIVKSHTGLIIRRGTNATS